MNLDPEEPNVRIDTRSHPRDGVYTIQVAMRNLHELTAKQADRYLKELIIQALKTAVREKYSAIQSIVDEIIHSDDTRRLIEDTIRAEIAEQTKKSIKDMFGDD